MRTKREKQNVMSMGGLAIGSMGLGSFNLAMTLDFIVAALLVIIGLGLVIITMENKHRAH